MRRGCQILLLALLSAPACYDMSPERPSGSLAALAPRGPAAFGRAPVNTAADPCSDFAAYACGVEASWGKLPPESDMLQWRWSAVWRFLDELAAGKHQDGTAGTALVKDLYTRCQDPRARDASLLDLRADLERIEKAATLPELARILGELAASGTEVLVRVAVLDDREHGRDKPFVGGIGLQRSQTRGGSSGPKPAQDPATRWRRLAAATGVIAPAEVDAALAVDGALAEPPVAALAPDRPRRFPWRQVLEGMGVPTSVPLRPLGPDTLARAEALVDLPLSQLKSYARVVLVDRSAATLPQAFFPETSNLAFTCVLLTSSLLQTEVAEAYLPTLAQERSEKIARLLFQALRDRFASSIETAPWMDPATRHVARAKVDAVGLRLIEDTDDEPEDDQLPAGSLLSATRYAAQAHWTRLRSLLEPDAPPARNSASFLIASNNARSNSIWLSSEIVRLPFVQGDALDPGTLGSLGTIVGHELAHVLSPAGRRYDASGSFHETWSPEAARAFAARASCVARQQRRPRVDEAVADLVGVEQAARLLATHLGAAPSHEELTAARRQFFVAFAQTMCGVEHLRAGETADSGDPHPPPRVRINGTVSNIPAFADAFACRAGAPMAPADRCTFW